jgi:hypothetical protein
MTEHILADPSTGEILAESALEGHARKLAAICDDITELEAELNSLNAEKVKIDIYLRACGIKIGARLYAGKHDGKSRYVVCVPPPRRAAQRVNAAACELHSEVLLGMGLGYMQYRAPSAADVRKKAPQLVAAGIDVGELLPEPTEAVIGNLEVVEET